MTLKFDIFACSAGQTEVTGAPNEIKILPLGLVKSQKGDFTVDGESFADMKQAFLARGNDIVIDYEHQTLKDVQAPAAGWIKDLNLVDGAITATVEWTPQGRKYLENKEYRYVSPVVLVRKSDGKAVALHSVALTNTPAIDGMFPIINSMDINFEGGNNNMDLLKQLAILLGLGEDATEEQVVNACGTAAADQKKFKEQTDAAAAAGEPVANKTVLGLLGLKDDAKTEDVTAAIVALSSKMPEGTVSAAEFKALKDKIAQRDADDTVTTALKTGKLTPAQKDWATEYALKDPAGFASFVEKAPQGVPMGELDMETKVNKEETVDDATLSVCKQLGVTKEDLAKFNKTE